MVTQTLKFNVRTRSRISIFGLFHGDPELRRKTTTKTRLIFSKSLGLRPRSALGSSGAAAAGVETAGGAETAEVDSCADSCWSGFSCWILSEISRRDSPSRGFRLNIWLAFSSTSCTEKIRIGFSADPDPAFYVNADVNWVSDQDPGFWWSKNFFLYHIFPPKNFNFVSLGLYEARRSYGTYSSQKRTSSTSTPWNLPFFYFFSYLFCSPGFGSCQPKSMRIHRRQIF